MKKQKFQIPKKIYDLSGKELTVQKKVSKAVVILDGKTIFDNRKSDENFNQWWKKFRAENSSLTYKSKTNGSSK